MVIDDFYESAKAFCNFVSSNTIDENNVEKLITLTADIYLAGFSLSEVEPDSNESPDQKKRLPAINIAVDDGYWMFFDSFDEKDIVCGSLKDDIADIYQDLERGITENNAGNKNNAAFEWKLMHALHWGVHAVNMLKVLHQIWERQCLEIEN